MLNCKRHTGKKNIFNKDSFNVPFFQYLWYLADAGWLNWLPILIIMSYKVNNIALFLALNMRGSKVAKLPN